MNDKPRFPYALAGLVALFILFTVYAASTNSPGWIVIATGIASIFLLVVFVANLRASSDE